MLIISYATKNTDYVDVMKTHLLPSIKRWGLDYDIEYIDNAGSWQANTHLKAEFCKKMLLKHKSSICFCDSDATIIQYPKLLYELDGYDVAYHNFDWFRYWRGQKGNLKREALSGTLYLNHTEPTLLFLNNWIELNKTNLDWEQRNMQKVLEQQKEKLKIFDLPIQYCAIVKSNGSIPDYICNPVILHFQYSRKLKHKIRGD